MDEFLKNDFVEFPDLEAAFEAVKGLVFGPLDPGYIKHKFNEIVREKKLERELEINPLSPLAHAREERDNRDRRDRSSDRLTIMALLSSERLREQLRDTYKAFDDTRDKGRELLESIAALRAQIKRERDTLLEQHTARHPVTKEPLIRYKDGRIIGANGTAVDPDDVKHIPPENMVPGERWDALERSETELDQLEARARNGMQSLDKAETKMEDGIKSDPDKAEQHMTEGKKTQESVAADIDEGLERMKEINQQMTAGSQAAISSVAPEALSSSDLARPKIGF